MIRQLIFTGCFALTSSSVWSQESSPSEAPSPSALERESEALVAKFSQRLSKGLASVEGAEEGRADFLKLVQTLKTRGFGKSPSTQDEHDEEEETQRAAGTPAVNGEGRRAPRGNEAELEFLKSLDQNQDRSVDSGEVTVAFREALKERLDRRLTLDADADDELTLKEYALGVPAKGDEVDADGINWHQRGHFEREDLDSDGVLTSKEILTWASTSLDGFSQRLAITLRAPSADGDADGILSVEELSDCINGKWTSRELPLSEIYRTLREIRSAELDAMELGLNASFKAK